MARFRHSWLGSAHPQRAARSPVIGTAPAGTIRDPVSVIGPRSNWPFCIVITPALSSIPEPARISELFAASTRYLVGPLAIWPMPLDASSTSAIELRTLPSWRANFVRASASGPTSACAGSEVQAPELAARLRGDDPELVDERDAVRAGDGRLLQPIRRRLHRVDPDVDHLRRRAGERVDRTHLAPDERERP